MCLEMLLCPCLRVKPLQPPLPEGEGRGQGHLFHPKWGSPLPVQGPPTTRQFCSVMLRPLSTALQLNSAYTSAAGEGTVLPHHGLCFCN